MDSADIKTVVTGTAGTDDDLAKQPLYPPVDETGYVDVSLVQCMLRLTPAQRVQGLCDFLDFIELARQARIKRYGYDPAAHALAETAD